MVVGGLYNIVDRIFIGQGVGPLALAGVTVAFGVQLIQIAFAVLIGVGTSARISICLGQGDKAKAEHFLGNGFALNLAISVTITLLGLLFLDPVLRLFGASEAVLPYARDFTRIVLIGTPLGTISMGLNGFIRAEGNPKVAMVTQLIGPILNTALCPLFIFGFGWGVAGSALANVVSQSVGSVWVLAYYLGGRSLLKIRRGNLIPRREISIPIITLGSAIAISELASSALMAIMNNQLSRYGGDLAVTAMGIVFALSNLVFLTLIGMNMGIQPLVGYNIGARLYGRVRKIERAAISAATLFATLVFVGVQLFPRAFVTLFAGGSAEVLDIGVHAMSRAFLALPVIGLQVLGAGYFQAAGRPTMSLFLGLTRQIIFFIPLLLVLPLFWGLDGVWYAGPLADATAFTVTGAFLWREMRALSRREAAERPAAAALAASAATAR